MVDQTAVIYEIRLQGHMDAEWADWFDGFSITCLESGVTLLRGPVADQSALHGVLEKIRNLNLKLISIQAV